MSPLRLFSQDMAYHENGPSFISQFMPVNDIKHILTAP